MEITSIANEDGFGGIQLAVQSDAGWSDWYQKDICGGWNKPEADKDQWDIDYANPDTFYIVVDLTTWSDWAKAIGGATAQAKVKVNSWPAQITLENAYLVTTTGILAKPATALDLNNGWAAQTVPEMTP